MNEDKTSKVEVAVTVLVLLFIAWLAFKLFVALLPFIILVGVVYAGYVYYQKNPLTVHAHIDDIRRKLGL